MVAEVVKAIHFVKHVPHVFGDNRNFDWNDREYECTNKDLVFLAKLNTMIEAGQLIDKKGQKFEGK